MELEEIRTNITRTKFDRKTVLAALKKYAARLGYLNSRGAGSIKIMAESNKIDKAFFYNMSHTGLKFWAAVDAIKDNSDYAQPSQKPKRNTWIRSKNRVFRKRFLFRTSF